MKKRFSSYVIFWAVLLALFNVIAFVDPGWIWFEKYSASFWIGYAVIMVTFVGQLLCARYALKEENATKLFYKLSLFSASYTGLIVTFVVGGLCMLISPLPYWVGAIVCCVVLAANVLSVVKAAVAIEEVQRIDQKVKQQTFFIKSLTVDADTLMARAKSEEVKGECKKVYEAVRYSDPMSNDALAPVESEIAGCFAKLSEAVAADDQVAVSEFANELIILIGDRNKKCKLLK